MRERIKEIVEKVCELADKVKRGDINNRCALTEYALFATQLEAEIEKDGELLGGGKYKKSCALAWDRYKATAIVVEEINKHLGHGEPPEISTIEYWKDKLLLKR